MPRPAINDYVFYKIVCIDEDLDLAYVGSTCNLYKRKIKHKHSCNNPNDVSYNNPKYQIIRANGGWENFKLIEIGKIEQITAREAEQIEEKHRLELRANMNAQRCYTTQEQRIEQTQERKKIWLENNKEYYKEYHQNNKEQILEKQKEYRETHKEEINENAKAKIKCECGCEVRKSNISHHRKTKKHLNLMKINNE